MTDLHMRGSIVGSIDPPFNCIIPTLGYIEVMLLGEAASKATVSYEQVIRETVKAVGYDNEDKGLDWRTMNVTWPRLEK